MFDYPKLIEINNDLKARNVFFINKNGEEVKEKKTQHFSGVGIKSIVDMAGLKKPRFDINRNQFLLIPPDCSSASADKLPPYMIVKSDMYGYPLGDKITVAEWNCDFECIGRNALLDIKCKYANDKDYNGRFPFSLVRGCETEDGIVLFFDYLPSSSNERNPVKMADIRFQFGSRGQSIGLIITLEYSLQSELNS